MRQRCYTCDSDRDVIKSRDLIPLCGLCRTRPEPTPMPEPESPLRLDTAFDEMDRLRKELGGAFEDPERTPTLKMDALYSELLTAINRPSRCLAMFKDWTNDR